MSSPGSLSKFVSSALIVACVECLGCAATRTPAATGSPGVAPQTSPVSQAPPDVSGTPEADIERISWVAREVTYHLAEKRQAQDVIWVVCLNDKLNQVHATRRAAAERLKGMQQARALGDEQGAMRERNRITLLRERATELLDESRQCVGESLGA
jgi:hypothetical protein